MVVIIIKQRRWGEKATVNSSSFFISSGRRFYTSLFFSILFFFFIFGCCCWWFAGNQGTFQFMIVFLSSFFFVFFLPFSFSASPVSKAIHNFIFLHQSPFSLSFYLSNNTKGYLARLITYKSIVFFSLSLSPKRFYIFLPQKTAAWAIKERKKKS